MVAAAEYIGQCTGFDGIAHIRTLSRGFDVADASRINATLLQGLTNHGRFWSRVRGFIAICLAIVIDRTPPNQGVNAIAIL